MLMRPSFVLLALFSSAPWCAAQIGGSGQLGPFIPDRDTILDTDWNGGRFEFTTIYVPSWVTVTLTGSNPAMLFSQGDATISGQIHADGESPDLSGAGGKGRVGGWDGGNGAVPGQPGGDGQGPGGGGGAPFYGRGESYGTGGSAGHATNGAPGCSGQGGTAYGGVDPLDFRGGSGGGGDGIMSCSGQNPQPFAHGGGGGGGAVALIADGVVSVTGTITANGRGANGAGSGGTIAIRALGGIYIGANAYVQALGGASGYIRLDSYRSVPDVQGRVDPVPRSLNVPDLDLREYPKLGQTFRFRVVSNPAEQVALFLAPRGAQLSLPPWGTLKVDPATMVLMGIGTTNSSDVDPFVEFPFSVPQNTALLAVPLFWQAFVFQTTLPSPQFSNLYITSITQ